VTGLAPTATVLAAYFCFSDFVLIVQCLYYNTINARRARREQAAALNSDAVAPTEDEPLLRRRRTSSAGLPGSQRRHETHEDSGLEPIRRIVTGEDDTPDRSPWLHNSLSLLAVWLVGAAGWLISYQSGVWDGPAAPEAPATDSPLAIGGMVLGYLSAVCYLWYV
jgi:solute carrier family 66 (lysosomal lysine-arginine transporter), member 1